MFSLSVNSNTVVAKIISKFTVLYPPGDIVCTYDDKMIVSENVGDQVWVVRPDGHRVSKLPIRRDTALTSLASKFE